MQDEKVIKYMGSGGKNYTMKMLKNYLNEVEKNYLNFGSSLLKKISKNDIYAFKVD